MNTVTATICSRQQCNKEEVVVNYTRLEAIIVNKCKEVF